MTERYRPEDYIVKMLENLPTVKATENTYVYVGYKRFRKYDISIGLDPLNAHRAPQFLGVDTWTVGVEIGLQCKDRKVLEAVKNEVLDLHNHIQPFKDVGFKDIVSFRVEGFRDDFDEDEVDDSDSVKGLFFSRCELDIDWNRPR